MGKSIRYTGTADEHIHSGTRFEQNGDPQSVSDSDAEYLLATGEFEDCGGAAGPVGQERDPQTTTQDTESKPEQSPQTDEDADPTDDVVDEDDDGGATGLSKLFAQG